MNPIADNPVIAPDRELEDDKNLEESDPRASAARSAAGRPARKISGSVSAVIRGIPSTREECAPVASTSGLKRSASLAADGRRIRSGISRNEFTRLGILTIPQAQLLNQVRA
jgi:hypothetical protein